jgi:hypothetical protein
MAAAAQATWTSRNVAMDSGHPAACPVSHGPFHVPSEATASVPKSSARSRPARRTVAAAEPTESCRTSASAGPNRSTARRSASSRPTAGAASAALLRRWSSTSASVRRRQAEAGSRRSSRAR